MSPEEISGTYDGWIIVRRWAATWLDTMFLLALLLGAFALGEKAFFALAGVWLLFLVAYYPFLEGLTGLTLGKRLCGLKVVDAAGATPGLQKATIRTLFRLIEINPALMGGIPAGFAVMSSKKRQRLGDAAANTFVLKAEDLSLLSPGGAEPVPSLGDFSLPSTPGALPPPPAPVLPRGKRVLWGLPGALLTTLVAGVMLPVSFGEFAAAEKTHHPTTITCAKFLAEPPTKGWYRLTGCEIDLTQASYQTSSTDETTETPTTENADAAGTEIEPVSEVMIPVYATREHLGKKTPLLVVSTDEATRNLTDEIRKLDENDEAAAVRWIEKNVDKLVLKKDFTGTVQAASTLPLGVRTSLEAGEDSALAPGYVVLKEGDEPWEPRPWVIFLIGLVAGIGAGLFWLIVMINATGGGERGPRPRAA